jgi:hypothetical protein
MRFPRLSVTNAALLIAFACVIGLVLFVVDDYADEQHEQQEKVDTGYIGCLRYNDTRLLFRSVIEDAYRPEPATPAPGLLETIAAIEDPAVRMIIANALNPAARPDPADDPSSQFNKQRNKTGTRLCDNEFPDRSDGISLETAVTVPPPPPEAP